MKEHMLYLRPVIASLAPFGYSCERQIRRRSVLPFTLALASRPILLTMKNEERSLTPLLVISQQNTLVKEQEGGYDEHAWKHVTDPCGYHPPVSSYIALCRPPRYPVDQHAAGRSDAHAPIRRLAHNDWYHHARRGYRLADRHRSHGCGLVGRLRAPLHAQHY